MILFNFATQNEKISAFEQLVEGKVQLDTAITLGGNFSHTGRFTGCIPIWTTRRSISISC